MDKDLLEKSASLLDHYNMPGEVLWEALASVSPALAAQLSRDGQPSTWLLVALSALGWLVALLVLLRARRMLRAGLRREVNRLSGLRYRAVERFYDLRAGLRIRLKRLSWESRASGTVHEEVELDDLDLAVLDHGATLAPGFAISVIDVAQELKARPSQVQRSLNKLRAHELVDPTLGSTDGYGNYRLTDSGAWFVAAHRKQDSASAAPLPESSRR